jgi:cell division protein FtsB
MIDNKQKKTLSKADIKVLSSTSKASILKKIGLINLLSILVISGLVLNIINTITLDLHIRDQSESLKKEKDAVFYEQKKLKKQIVFYKTKDGIEKLARESLGLVKADEIPVKYVETNGK